MDNDQVAFFENKINLSISVYFILHSMISVKDSDELFIAAGRLGTLMVQVSNSIAQPKWKNIWGNYCLKSKNSTFVLMLFLSAKRSFFV